MSPWGAVVAYVLGCLVIWGLWAVRHPAIIDPGPAEGEEYPAWDDHSWEHLSGAAAVALIFYGLTRSPSLAFFASVSLWALVELAQKFPRKKKHDTAVTLDYPLGVESTTERGHWDWWDVLWDILGAGGVAILCALFTRG